VIKLWFKYVPRHLSNLYKLVLHYVSLFYAIKSITSLYLILSNMLGYKRVLIIIVNGLIITS